MQNLKFAHLADLHLGGFREKKLTQLNFSTFKLAIKQIIEEKVDFVLFAGDIFNNAMPSIDLVEMVVVELMKLKEKKIPLYVIGGSHDYSNSGKSFISLLHKTELFEDIAKWKTIDKGSVELLFTKNEKLKLKITGILGKKNGLDKNVYRNLNSSTLSKDYFNIFMFHTTLNDIKPDFMKMVKSEVTSNFLPKGFDYYAAGHVHTHIESKFDKGYLSYPGPLFPNNFTELKREKPIYNLCSFNFETREVKIKKKYLNTYEKEFISVEINNLNPVDARSKIESNLEKIEVKDKIILIQIEGIVDGKIKDLELNKIIFNLYQKGAFHVLRNTYKLTSSNLKLNIDIESKDLENVEKEIILKNLTNDDKISRIKKLFNLDLEKLEDEKVAQYEERVKGAIEKSLER